MTAAVRRRAYCEPMQRFTSAGARSEALVLFDGDCGFCTSSATWMSQRLTRPGKEAVRLVPWQDADLTALGTDAARAQREVLWVAPDGSVAGGAPAVAAWMRSSGGPWAMLGRVLDWPGVRRLAASAYRLVADHRDRLPGGTPACATGTAGSVTRPVPTPPPDQAPTRPRETR